MVKVVAIDGPAGVGKSTVAKTVASRLGFTYVDTGAMYRAVTLKVLRSGASVEDEARVSKIVSGVDIELSEGAILLDGKDVSEEIRAGKVTKFVPRISAYPAVRSALVARQREYAQDDRGLVMEGRDIGTVVFPNAKWKFFLDAAPEVRARRRHEELAQAGKNKELAWVLSDILERDREDRERPIAPLRAADGATTVDTSRMSVEAVIELIVGLVAA